MLLVSATRTAENRLKKLRVWLDVLADALDVYDDLQSRTEETSSISGFAPEPWRRGQCGACGGRGCAYDLTSRQRYLDIEEVDDQRLRARVLQLGGIVFYRDVDQYRFGVPKTSTFSGGELSKSVRDSKRRDASIANLERWERIRAGLEVMEDRDVRQLRIIDSRLRGFTQRLRAAVDGLPAELRRRLPDDAAALAALDAALPGAIPRPPVL